MMFLLRFASVIAFAVCLNTDTMAEIYSIQNPASNIRNPASSVYNPATNIDNPAANIYNPAARMNNPDPLSPPTQKIPKPVVAEAATPVKSARLITENPQPKPVIPRKTYHYKTAEGYVQAAKKAFVQDNYVEFLSITEDALRRIQGGTLKATKKTVRQLAKYRTFGYGLL